MLRQYKLYVVLFTIFISISCKRNKLYQLTENNCKYWDLNYVESIHDTIKETKKTVSLKFCKNGYYNFFYLYNSKRTEYKRVSDYVRIPKNRWIYENDTLIVNSLVDGDTKYTIKYISKDELVLKTEKGGLYHFKSSNDIP